MAKHSGKPGHKAAHSSKHVSTAHLVVPGGDTEVAPLVRIGAPGLTITYRSTGAETVNLLSASHGVQQLASFNAAAGDVIGVDAVLRDTMAQANLSDVGNWITSAQSAAGTTLYFDPTGSGLQGTPFAVLQGVDTTVAQLVADGGMQYTPTAFEINDTFTPTFSLRAAGLETVDVLALRTGIAAQTLIGFNPAAGDVLQLAAVLNQSMASANLSDIGQYITATYSGGDTTLSVDTTGTGAPGRAFVVLQGVDATVSQLVADGALAYTPTQTMMTAAENSMFTYRAAGMELATLLNHGAGTPPVLENFSAAAGDSIGAGQLLYAAGIAATPQNAADYFSTTQSGGSTTLWFNSQGTAASNPAGSGVAEAVLQNTVISLSTLLADQALNLTGAGDFMYDGQLMHMGCTNAVITYRAAGHENVCLQAAVFGEQVLVGFNVAAGDSMGVDDVLEQTPAHADLSDATNYLTSTTSAAGTTIYFDKTGTGKQGTPVALLEGVSTTVAALIADGGIQYVPDAIFAAPVYGTTYTFRPSGLTTLNLQPLAPGAAAQQIAGFGTTLADVLQLSNILNPTTAAADLSNVANYITAKQSGGNTTLSVDPTGHGGAGTAFAVLQGVTVTVAQLLNANALAYTPTATSAVAAGGAVFSFRPEGQETAIVGTPNSHLAVPTLAGFSLTGGDVLSLADVLGTTGLQAGLANLADFVTTRQVGADTQLWMDPTGQNPAGGHEFADLQNTSVTMSQLLTAHAFILT